VTHTAGAILKCPFRGDSVAMLAQFAHPHAGVHDAQGAGLQGGQSVAL